MHPSTTPQQQLQNIYAFSAKSIDNLDIPLSSYKGKVLLIVNIASKCGFTKQYHGLQELYAEYQARGLVILGFPCNQFGAQEPGDEAEIKNFCQLNYDVTFPLFAKIAVNGANAHPLYKYLKDAAPGILNSRAIKWNFTKFLVSNNGKIIKRFASTITPEELKAEIDAMLSA